MNIKHFFVVLAALVSALASGQGRAQTTYSEDFTGSSTTNDWHFLSGACLTAGSGTSTASPGKIPGCATILGSYYNTNHPPGNAGDPYLNGGYNGYLGSTSSGTYAPDPVGNGALRFTNGFTSGQSYGKYERGAILSANTFSTAQGLQVTFKTITYRGDSGNNSHGGINDGADGISFFLMDGSKPAGIGATGGSLAYSCSNQNPNYDGLNGGYIGLGIDEFGNFLNGTNLVSGYTGTNVATGDNSAYGYGSKGGRIGLRGAGSISWAALSDPVSGYGTNQGSSFPYYPSSLATTYSNSNYSCSSGFSNYNNQLCYSTCPITRSSYPGAPSGGTPTIAFNGTVCTYTKSGITYPGPTPTTVPVTVTGGSGNSLAVLAVQQACSTGNLYNYYNPNAPVSITTATLTTSSGATNTANPAGILDYAPIPGAYKELTGFTLANESATKRAQGTPIFYNLKITQNGLLSLAYSTGAAYSYIIKDQSITGFNGNLPDTFRFGFAGSTGGSTNIHEIMCFKAASADTSGSSATVNEKQSAKVQAGTQAYFAFYNPNEWTGALTANNLIDTAGVVSVAKVPNWDASCLLTSGTGPDLTGVAGAPECATTSVPNPTPAPSNRVMLTWDTANNGGIPFEWSNLNSAQKAVLDDENNVPDSTATAQFRLNYLRGDTTNELTSAGSGLYRARKGILGDIVDSSPSWVGPPSSKYTAAWKDRLQPAASMLENSGTQSYLQFVAAEQTRLNVVYTGANDGFLHGFRAGGFDSTGNYCGTTGSTLTSCAATPNDGQEVLAYMPGSTLVSAALPGSTGGCISTTSTGTAVQNIHGWSPAYSSGGTNNVQCETPELDISAPQYGHNFFVDATPGTGDLFYGGVWHTWLVGGLGIGGAAIYALNVTDPTTAPTNFAESNASNVVIGEWNSSSISCTNVSNCGNNLGNTFGTPQIRRLHNGNWGVIFGNGFGSTSGDAGIYVMSIDSTSGAKTFYYLSTGSSGAIFSGTGSQAAGVVTISAVASGAIAVGNVLSGPGVVLGSTVISFGTGTGGAGTYNVSTSGTVSSGTVRVGNGIAFTTPADLDGDHITDYVYAGDLKGNVWRFDLHDSSPANWTAAASPLFTTPSGQPITTQVLVVTSIVSGSAPRLLIEFGTGQRAQLTNLTPATFAGGTQALYGIWDWNLSAWNALGSSQYASLAATSTATGNLPSSFTIPCTASSCTRLTQQTLSAPTSAGVVDGTSAVVCWQGSTACTTGDTSFGWYASLPSSSEQIIFNPVFFQGAILVNSTVPAANVLTSCTITTDTGYTYALSIANGGVFANAFPKYTNNGTLVSDSVEAGVQTNATGSVYVVTTAENTSNVVYQTVSGTPGAQQINIPSNTKAKRLTWIERR